ncbi:MAG: methionine synthase [Candidatus Hodarchaeota archaeon]
MKILTTVIGSYPPCNTKGLDAIKGAVDAQLRAGIDLISDGQVRYDMIKYFTRDTPGFKIVGHESVIAGKISPKINNSIIAKDLLWVKQYVGERAKVKGIVTGPITLISSCKISKTSPYDSIFDRRLYRDTAEALGAEVKMLIEAGADSIQIDEPFYSVGVPMDLAKECIELIIEGVQVPVSLHACGDIRKVFDHLLDFDGVDVLSHEFAASPQNLEVISRSKLENNNKKLGVGCVKTNAEQIETHEEVLNLLRKAAKLVGLENMWIHPDCGLTLLNCDTAELKLKTMMEATHQLIEELSI